MKPGDLSAPEITGGYLLELDTYFDEVNKFRSALCNYPVNIKEPDEETLAPAQLTYITDYFNAAERAAMASDSLARELIDYPSFVDFFLISEVTSNYDTAHPKSCYMYKTRSGKLYAGPAWDYDWGTFQSPYGDWACYTSLWYTGLLKNPEFLQMVKTRWAALKPSLQQLYGYIDQQAALITQSQELNRALWECPQVNNDWRYNFVDAVNVLKVNLRGRITWLDSKLSKL